MLQHISLSSLTELACTKHSQCVPFRSLPSMFSIDVFRILTSKTVMTDYSSNNFLLKLQLPFPENRTQRVDKSNICTRLQ